NELDLTPAAGHMLDRTIGRRVVDNDDATQTCRLRVGDRLEADLEISPVVERDDDDVEAHRSDPAASSIASRMTAAVLLHWYWSSRSRPRATMPLRTLSSTSSVRRALPIASGSRSTNRAASL